MKNEKRVEGTRIQTIGEKHVLRIFQKFFEYSRIIANGTVSYLVVRVVLLQLSRNHADEPRTRSV